MVSIRILANQLLAVALIRILAVVECTAGWETPAVVECTEGWETLVVAECPVAVILALAVAVILALAVGVILEVVQRIRPA